MPVCSFYSMAHMLFLSKNLQARWEKSIAFVTLSIPTTACQLCGLHCLPIMQKIKLRKHPFA